MTTQDPGVRRKGVVRLAVRSRAYAPSLLEALSLGPWGRVTFPGSSVLWLLLVPSHLSIPRFVYTCSSLRLNASHLNGKVAAFGQ